MPVTKLDTMPVSPDLFMRLRSIGRELSLASEKPRKLLHAVLAIAALGVHGGIVEENAVTAGFELLADDELLVGTPVRVVHTGRTILTAVPGRQRLAVAILLQPLGRRCVKPFPKFCRPVFVECLQLDDGGGADVPERQPDTVVAGVAQISQGVRQRGLALFGQFFRDRQTPIAKASEAGHVKDRCAAGRRGFCLIADGTEMIEGMAGFADAQKGEG